ncbi:stage II sporulation protein P [Marasmitruncus massiliensis]|jgi:stage II sporulation protein P|uniref:stage II sporulation protein P n=1 Tax=Marasmitruncus massiliensis TaxID=1944642 RepID=UPI000C7AD282|nr:stage II sporulation protein P [Marasmitruncus massiliensis]MBE6905433.1 stage II sporulation protein P [Oscillospiraceae bacterium]
MLKHYGRKQQSGKRPWILLAVAAILPIGLTIAAVFSVDMSAFTEKAALVSAMISMPEGSLSLLENRFSDKLDKEYYNGNESEVAPYVEPFPEEENSDTSSSASSGASSSAPPRTPQKATSQDPSPASDNTHEVPEAYRGTLIQENMSGSGSNLLAYGEGLLRNYTQVPDSEVVSIMKQGLNIQLEDTKEPQVLIFHTHATESFEPYDSSAYDIRNTWRSTDNTKNMVAVGNALAKELQDAGIGVLHDTTQHDYPSYNGAYERSAKTIQSYLDQYPSIKIALDVHRDAIQREEKLIVKPVVEIDGKKAAQLMIITGSDDGTMNVPKWRENLRFAASLQDAIEQDYPQLTRPIFFCYRKYNMDKTTGSLLLEVGASANTLEESIYTAHMVGKSLAKLLTENNK